MFLSTIKGAAEVDTINIDFLTKSMASQGFELRKQKNKDLESGLNTIAFHIEKNGVFMAVFIMKIDKNLYICAGYYNGRLVEQKEVKYESDIPSTIVNIFNSIKNRSEDQPIRFDSELEKVRVAAERIEQREKNMLNFTQEVKSTQEYQSFKRMEKKAYEKICNDSQCIIDKRDSIKQKNDALIEPLLKVEACKQSLQSTLLAFEQESQYLSNVKERLKEHIQSVKSRESSLTPGNMHEVAVNELIQQLTKAKKMELQLKYLVS